MSTIADSPFVRLLTVADLPAMVALQKAVTAKLPAGFVRSKTESEVRAYLDGTHGVAYGIVEGSGSRCEPSRVTRSGTALWSRSIASET
jgi:hypothetical protein